MSTEENVITGDQHDQLPDETNALNQGTARSEETPSWDDNQDAIEYEDPIEDERDSSMSAEDTGSEESQVSQEIEDDEQKNTPPDSPRRVLSFEDYFKDQN